MRGNRYGLHRLCPRRINNARELIAEMQRGYILRGAIGVPQRRDYVNRAFYEVAHPDSVVEKRILDGAVVPVSCVVAAVRAKKIRVDAEATRRLRLDPNYRHLRALKQFTLAIPAQPPIGEQSNVSVERK